MDGLQYRHVYLLALNPNDPDFSRQSLAWFGEIQCEIGELVASAKDMVAQTWDLMAEIDRILARK